MKVQVISILYFSASFLKLFVAASNDQDGPPTNRRRVNEDIAGENGDSANDEDTDGNFITNYGESLINHHSDSDGSSVDLNPPNITFTTPQAPAFDSLNQVIILPPRSQNLTPGAGLLFTQPSQLSQPTSSQSGSSSSQMSQSTPLSRLRSSDFSGQPSPMGPPCLTGRSPSGTRNIGLFEPPGVSTASSAIPNSHRFAVRPFPSLSDSNHLGGGGGGDTLRRTDSYTISELPGNVIRAGSIIRGCPRNNRAVHGLGSLSHGESLIHLSGESAGVDQPAGTAVHFDASEEDFFNIIRSASSEASPPHTRYYGEYIDPENGSRRYVPLPLTNFSDDKDDENDENEDDDDEEEVIVGRREVPSLAPRGLFNNDAGNNASPAPSSSLQTPPRGQSSVAILPRSTLESLTSPVNYSTPNILITKKSTCTPPRVKQQSNKIDSFVDPCELAESVFAEEVGNLHGIIYHHTAFPDQDILLGSIDEFARSSRLNEIHLSAFEIDFPIFYKLVSKCPRKYFFPALALSLQYDEDFPKFLKLYFYIMDGHFICNHQSILIKMFLNMRIISNSAFQFFSSRKNSMFFFSDFSNCSYGKFSPNVLAEGLIRYRNSNSEMEYSHNPLRQFLLSFDYFNVIKLFHNNQSFSKVNLLTVFNAKSLFRSQEAFNSSVYKLFKFANDNTEYFANILLFNNAVEFVFKEALKQEDFVMIESLFKKFDLERKEGRMGSRKGEVSVTVLPLNKRFCSVKLKFKRGHEKSLNLILPLF